MNLGTKGKALIQSFEKLSLIAYRDSGGIWTIGWGHTRNVCAGMTCTPEQADAWLAQDTASAVDEVNRSVYVTLTQNEFDALVSFTYNVGIGAEAHSTLVKLVNLCHFEAAAAEFLKWDHVDGVVNEGLTRRREAERALFNTLEET